MPTRLRYSESDLTPTADFDKDRGFWDIDMAAFESVLKINTLGTVIPSRVFGLQMAKSGGGAILNFGSMNTYRPLTRVAPYAMSKAAIANWTQFLAQYLAPAKIRVNAIAPGFFVNDRSRKILCTPDGGLTARGEQVMAHTPARRFGEAKELLGGYPIDLVSVHDPDEYLAGVGRPVSGRRTDILGAYRALFELKAKGVVKGVGIGSKDWTVIRDLAADVPFDWTMFACAPTILRHPPELLDFIAGLAAKGVTVIDSAVFNGGFLTGGNLLDYRPADPVADARLFAVRDAYLKLCAKYALDPAAVAVEYALRLPGVKHVALNTSKPERVAVNAAYGTHRAPEEFWNELKEIL